MPHRHHHRLSRQLGLFLLTLLFLYTPTAFGQDVCWRQSYGRGVGTIPTSCAGGKVNDAGLCYNKCKSGYLDGGPMCWQACPSGKTEIGPTCSKGVFEGCANGMINLGLTCGRLSYGRGVGTIPTRCGPGEEYDAGLCYKKCTGDRAGVGPVCWQNTCPADYPVACGMGCSTSTAACAKSIFRQTSSVLEVAQNAIGTGRVLNQTRRTAKYVGREAAKHYIKKELQKAASKHAAKVTAQTMNEVSEYVLGEMDDGTGQFDIALLDPTGIADVVKAFNKPICGEGVKSSPQPTLASITDSSTKRTISRAVPRPVTDERVYVSTSNARGLCLSIDKAAKSPAHKPCSANDTLIFSKVKKYTKQDVYQIEHPTAKKCLFSNKDGRFAYYKCNSAHNDQLWYTALTPEAGSFLLINANSGKCLFSNKDGRIGVYKCNGAFNDQLWTTKRAPKPPTKQPVHIFSANGKSTCVTASSGIKPGPCTAKDEFVIEQAGAFRGQDSYNIRHRATRQCLGLTGKGALKLDGKCSNPWYTMPATAGGGMLLADAKTSRCLFSNRDGRIGTYKCNTSFNDQVITIKPTTRGAGEITRMKHHPKGGDVVRLSTKANKSQCLSSHKNQVKRAGCDHLAVFEVTHERAVPTAYTIRLKHRDSGLCLGADGKTPRYQPCKAGASEQFWLIKPRGGAGHFALINAKSNRCLFADGEGKIGTYKCEAKYTDQDWMGWR